jgi:cell division protein FtsI (penicillin-binding protein 3)
MLDEPKNEKWGSEAAAPIFGAIGGRILRYLEVPPRDTLPVQIVAAPAGEPAAPIRLASAIVPIDADGALTMPDLRGQALRQALGTLAPFRPPVTLTGQGRVVQQAPAAGAPLAPGTPVHLTLAVLQSRAGGAPRLVAEKAAPPPTGAPNTAARSTPPAPLAPPTGSTGTGE